MNAIEITDPFLRFDTKIYFNASYSTPLFRSSLDPNEWNNKITNDAFMTFDNHTSTSYYGWCPEKVIDGITHYCEILEYFN